MIFWFIFLFYFSLQARELLEVSHGSFLNQEEVESRVRIGAPPLLMQNIRMMNSVSFSETQINEMTFEKNEKLKLKELSWAPLFLIDTSSNWKVVWGILTSYRSEGENFQMSTKSFSSSQFINFTSKNQNETGWNWSLSAYVPDKNLGLPVIPAVTFSYLSEDRKRNVQIRGPFISHSYDINENLQWLSRFYFRSGVYRLSAKSEFVGRGSFVQSRQTRIETGLKSRISKHTSLQLQIGYQLRGNLQIVNSQFKDPDNLSERAAAYLDLTLSVLAF